MQVNGKVVFVTGANRGIGEALVKAFLAKGAAKVYAAVRTESAMTALKQLDPARVVVQKLDIVDFKMVTDAAAACGDVNILVNNAGIGRNTSFLSPPNLEAARAEMEINYFGTLAMCQTFAPKIATNGNGAIVNICSLLGFVNMPVIGTYCASKAAVHSLLQGLRGELAPKGVKVIGVYPGPVETRMTDGLEMPKATPADVAAAVVAGIENDQEDIFPDPMSQGTYEMLQKDAKQVEKQFMAFIPQ